MLFTFLPTAAFAADTSSPVQLDASNSAYGITYTLNSNGTASVSKISSSCPADVVIPEIVIDSSSTPYTVTKIDCPAYRNSAKNKLESIHFPSTITSINNTFINCIYLKSVTFDTPSQLTTIAAYAFSGCSSLTSIEIPNGVKLISDGTFEDCSALSTVKIPASIIRIVSGAFAGCTSLKEVKYDGDKWDDINSDTANLTPNVVKQRRTITFTTNTTTPDKIDDQYVYDGDSVTKPADPTKEHYTFDGWYKDDDSKYDFNTLVSGDLHLSAKWIPETYVIKFDVNGHGLDTAPGDIKDVPYNSTFKKPDDPTETGYTFIGWYTDSALTNKFEFDEDGTSKPITDNTYEITLYAKWEINKYTVTFDFNTGKPSTPKTEEVEYGNPVSEPAKPTNTGYTFGGWYTDKACTDGKEFTFGADGKSTTPITDHITLYAKWEINKYTVTFDVDGQTDRIPPVSVEHGNGVSKPTDPTKEGYTFDGWYTDATYTNKYTLWGDSITRNTTFYARWNVNQYALTIHYTDTDSTSKPYDYGTTIKLDIPQRDGYTFDGWIVQTEDDKIEAPTPNLNQSLQYEFTMPASNVTLTAKWLKDAYTVTFNGMEHELDIVRINVKRNTPVDKPADPVDDGYTFHGWYTDKDCTTAFDFNTPITADMTLYAKWTKNAEPVKPSDPDKPNKPDNPSEPDKPSNPDKPSKPETYSVFVFDGEAELDGETVTKAEAGKTITVRLMADIVPAGQTFDHWEVLPETLELKDAQSTETTFEMPEEAVTLRAVYRDIPSAPQSVDPASAALGAAVLGTGVVIAGWTAYNIGLELYAKWVLPAGAEMPNTRGELAVLLWQAAGSPEPATLTEGMSELEKAERWVVENGLMAESKNSSFAPEEKVSKLEVFLTLKKAKALTQ